MTLPLFLNISGDSGVNLLNGEVLEGLFFGFFGAYFIIKVTDSDKSSAVCVIFSYLITFSLITMLLLLDVLYSGMGGMDAFIGAIVGVSLSNAIIGKGYSLSALLVILIAVGTYFPQFMINDELIEFEVVLQNENQVSEELVPNEKKLDLRDLTGSFEAVKDSSIVLFVVGEKEETEGAFKRISGVLDLKEDISKSSLKMKLNLDDFTTFNSFRDESLMEESYFNQGKYPELSYTSSSIEKVDNFTYKVLGEFKMLGVSSLIEVTLQWIEVNGTDFILGEGSLDRTLFGMSPSAIEGNIVSFNYRVQLKKSSDI
jgi:polyisoprenoid-binding protein YceI